MVELKLHTLVTAAAFSTAFRIVGHVYGGSSHTSDAVKKIGAKSVALEMLAVILRFLSVTRIASAVSTAFRWQPLPVLVVTGLVVSFAVSLAGRLLDPFRSSSGVEDNPALVYLMTRPFEPIPVLFEFVTLHMLATGKISFGGEQNAVFLLCVSLIVVLVAVSHP